MKILRFSGYALCSCAAALLAGCGGSQPPIGAPRAMPQSAGITTLESAAAARSIGPESSYQVLYTFKGGNGAHPEAGLINVNGTLYGTTIGIRPCCGTVYSIGTGGTEKVLYTFRRGSGSSPDADLIDENGTLYGTTFSGGGAGCHSSGCGTVFSITKSGTEKVLHAFAGGFDGANPPAGLINVNGVLYGTTTLGGAGSVCSAGCGTVFSITKGGTHKVLYSFRGESDGSYPVAGLIDVNGVLYGTTSSGGGGSGCGGCGTVFSVTTTGTENVLYTFHGSDGRYPHAGLTDVNGTLYGTTFFGGGAGCGGDGCGTVFSVTTTGKENVLFAFADSNGRGPKASLINVKDTLYGTAGGGTNEFGIVFSVTTAGMENVLYNFAGGSDGATPTARLVNVKGTLYGTTAYGGSYKCYRHKGCGTVFALTP